MGEDFTTDNHFFALEPISKGGILCTVACNDKFSDNVISQDLPFSIVPDT